MTTCIFISISISIFLIFLILTQNTTILYNLKYNLKYWNNLIAKSLKLSNLQFPVPFQLTTDDLIFPYNADIWRQSPLSKDTIAVTAILDSDGKLSTAGMHVTDL